MNWQDDPAPDGLAAMLAALGPDIQIANVRRLVGGAMAVHLIELTQDASRRAVVLKRFPPGVGSPENEWDALGFAHAADLPSPAPLHYDSGDWFGGPAIVMTALPGRLCLDPANLERWTAALADVLATIHATPVDAVPASMHRPGIWDRWDQSGLAPGPRTDAVSAAIAELRTRDWVMSFCHCDFYPGNVLFHDGAVVGVVDWISAKLSPFLNDLGRLRGAIAVWPGGEAPDLLATAYAKRTGRSLDGLAYWDILTGSLTLQGAANGHLHRHLEVLQIPLDASQAAERATAFIDAALAKCG
ncbi:MAG: phosphotransferase [Candidatus Latescibacteria bacterium]|nr:phosphotransferase [Candidatus Latescibacterota bacterium]